MPRSRGLRMVVLALSLVALQLAPAIDAKEKKKKRSRPAAARALPAHPSQLEFGPLAFEVPDAADYRHELSNGIPVYVAEDHDLPLVEVTVTLRAGRFLDPDDKPGVASLTGAMLRRGGTAAMTAEEFDERIDYLAANLGSFSGSIGSGASFDCITGVFDETLELFFQMLRTPRFQQDRFQVEKNNLLERMKQRNDDPESLSSREWNWLIRGPEHFTAYVLRQAELDAITRDDLIAFHRRFWRPENMIVAVAGDVDTTEVLAKLERRFAEWKAEGPRVDWPPPAPRHVPRPGVYYVDKEIPQGRVVIGHLGIQRVGWDDPEPFALDVMSDILGAPYTSRLFKRIRSDEGLAYDVRAAFGVGNYWPGTFRVLYQSKNSTVAYAAQIAVEEIRRLRTEPVSEEELNVVKSSLIDDFPRRFESPSQIINTFVNDEYEGRPHAYWKSYRDRIRAVTAEDVMQVAKKYLQPDKLLFLIVGKWDEVRPGDADGKASMKEFFDGRATRLPLRDPLTLQPIEP